MEVDKNNEETSLGEGELGKIISSAIDETVESKEKLPAEEVKEEAQSQPTAFSPYKKLDELNEDELKKIEATLAARMDNWAGDEDDALEETLKSFLLLSQFGSGILLILCSLIPRTSILASHWANGLFIAILLIISGLFVKKIYWQWAPLCSLLLTLSVSFYFIGRLVHFYHKDGFLSFLSIFFSGLVGLSTLVILWRIYKNKSMEL